MCGGQKRVDTLQRRMRRCAKVKSYDTWEKVGRAACSIEISWVLLLYLHYRWNTTAMKCKQWIMLPFVSCLLDKDGLLEP